MTAPGRIRRLNSGSAGIVDAARCSACGHPARIHNALGCVSAQCECDTPRADLDGGGPRLEVPDGVESTPAVKAAAPPVVPARPLPAWDPPKLPPKWSQPAATHPTREAWDAVEPEATDAPVAPQAESTAPVAAAPAPAAPPAAEAGPVGEPPAPVAELPPWLPGAGVPRGGPAPMVAATSAEDAARQVDAIIAAAKVAAKRPRPWNARPAAPSALGPAVVVGEPDAAGEVAVASTSAAVTASCADVRFDPLPAGVQATPGPLDVEPFLGGALTYYAAWACPTHPVQRRHDPGACDCGRALVPVYVVVHPRSLV